MRGLAPVDISQLQNYNVNVEGQPLVNWQPLWDYQTYANAGFTGKTLFFQVPVGQGTKTLEDTNMKLGGQLGAPVNMLVTGIESVFRPGVSPVVLAGGVAVTASLLNDLYAVHGARMSVEVTIGDKPWLQEAPLGVFPSQFYLDGPGSAVHYTQAAPADELALADYAAFRGPMYQIVPWRLISSQTFVLAVNSPALVALPSGIDARWGFRLHGYRFGLAQ